MTGARDGVVPTRILPYKGGSSGSKERTTLLSVSRMLAGIPKTRGRDRHQY